MPQVIDVRATQIAPDRACLATMLGSGGDQRIAIDPISGRNKYGVPLAPAEEEIWFSSSTASAISPLGFNAAGAVYDAFISGSAEDRTSIEKWFDSIRSRILTLVGCPGTEIILCASGTETELLALAVSRNLLRRPLTNIVIASQETGVGVMHAASGTHFDATTALSSLVEKGAPIQGWERIAIETRMVDIRHPDGSLRKIDDVDEAVRHAVSLAVDAGRDVQLHVLDTSKAGRGGPSRSLAKSVAAAHASTTTIVVDACQLRCSFDTIRRDLESGFMVMITGSKFAGGPPFCGALLIPAPLVARLQDLSIPAGLADYSARFDWPKGLRPTLDKGDYRNFNLGLGLRWEAALAEMEAFNAIHPARRDIVVRAFGRRVRDLVLARPHLSFLDPDAHPLDRPPTIFAIVSGDGEPSRTAFLHRALREAVVEDDHKPARICHLGQPVKIGERAAVRVCIGMPTIRRIADRLDRMPLDQAFAPESDKLSAVFDKWDILEERATR